MCVCVCVCVCVDAYKHTRTQEEAAVMIVCFIHSYSVYIRHSSGHAHIAKAGPVAKQPAVGGVSL